MLRTDRTPFDQSGVLNPTAIAALPLFLPFPDMASIKEAEKSTTQHSEGGAEKGAATYEKGSSDDASTIPEIQSKAERRLLFKLGASYSLCRCITE